MSKSKAYTAIQTSIVMDNESFAPKLKHRDALIALLHGEIVGDSNEEKMKKQQIYLICSTVSASVLCQVLPLLDTELFVDSDRSHPTFCCYFLLHGIISRFGQRPAVYCAQVSVNIVLGLDVVTLIDVILTQKTAKMKQ